MKALILDLDGTLVDSVYANVLAWQLAFAEAGIPIDGWRLHRRMAARTFRTWPTAGSSSTT
jgi:beta-phosphoglucomutase-like phosphatase (HAD superfamily)